MSILLTQQNVTRKRRNVNIYRGENLTSPIILKRILKQKVVCVCVRVRARACGWNKLADYSVQ
jgi:hypothetical protein